MPKKSNGPTRTPEEADEFRNDKEAAYVEQLADLMRKRQGINVEMANVRQSAKDSGFNSTLLQKAASRMIETIEEREKRRDFERELRSLTERLGILSDTPLGQAAQAAAA